MSNTGAVDRAGAADGDFAEVRAIIDAHQSSPGAMLPLLHAIQAHLGWVPAAVVPLVAEGLNVSRAEVQGVLDFYHDFRRAPVGRHVVQICRAESCQAMGAGNLEAHARASLGLDFHQTSPDGALTLEPVYCLGNCACSPAIRVDDDIYGRMDRGGLRRPDRGAARGGGRGMTERSTQRVFVPIDSSALSVGAERVAQAIQAEAERRGESIELVRNGSRGLFWLEPMVEVETPAGRIAYGPVRPERGTRSLRCRLPDRPAASPGVTGSPAISPTWRARSG